MLMRIQPNSRLLFIGDSITDCGRKRPFGEGAIDGALGNGYVSLIDAALASSYPDYGIKIINVGVSGNTIHDLKYRWASDVLALKPDWLSVLIGINDVWQQLTQSEFIGQDDSVHGFAHILDELIQQVRPSLQGLILMTPYYLEANLQNPMRVMMDQYGEQVGEVAAVHEAILVDTQRNFDRILKWTDPLDLADDHVHINLSGHMILARAFLDQVGFSWKRNPE
jgi:lysophospholipase L1-like esterase